MEVQAELIENIGDCNDNILFGRGSEEQKQNEHILNNLKKKNDFNSNMTLWNYLYTELTRGYWLENDKVKFTERRKRVYTFMKIPRELEKFMVYGFFQCLDAFLFIFTFLPLRFLKAIFKYVVRCPLSSCWPSESNILDPAEICDLLKALVLIICCFLMNYIDVSMMYHVIRGQTVIKLYIFFNMLDVADKLFSSFGQDILDSLFWTATEKRGRKREYFKVILHFILAVFYVFLHTLLVLLQANTLNVAFNSHNKALLTIMVSNNFVELKASVFKKFERSNLFQMSCSDVRERFHLVILLMVVGIRNLAQFSWDSEHFWILIPDILLVLLAEFLVDWVKHAFITKFNEIPFDIYREYNVSIAYDMAGSRQNNAFSDHLDVVSRRMGFIPLPLAVLLVRIVLHSTGYKTSFSILLLFIFYICLVTFKVLNSIVLLGVAYDLIENNKLIVANRAKEVCNQNNNSNIEIFKPTSKDDLDLLNVDKSVLNDIETSESVKFRRTRSLAEFCGGVETDEVILNNKNDGDKNEKGANNFEINCGDSNLRRVSMNSHEFLLYNSTVSLQSIELNEALLNVGINSQTEKSISTIVKKQPLSSNKAIIELPNKTSELNKNETIEKDLRNSEFINSSILTSSRSSYLDDNDVNLNKKKFPIELIKQKSPLKIIDTFAPLRNLLESSPDNIRRRNTLSKEINISENHNFISNKSEVEKPLAEVDRYTMCSNRIVQ